MFIEQPPEFFRKLYPGAVWRMDPNEKAVYLTFDDGPIPEVTPWVLDHTFNHIRGFEYTAKNYLGNTEQAKIFMEMGGDINCNVEKVLYPLLFRPPHGHMFANQYLTLKRTYKIVMWDLVTRDYSKKLRGPQVLANVMRYARNGSIITFHDSLKSWCNGNLQYALPRAIDFLKEEGYEFKVL